MLSDAIKRSKIENEEEVKVSIEIKENIYGKLSDIAEDNNIKVPSLCKNIIESSIENELCSSINTTIDKEIIMNIWIIASKYLDGEEDLSQECINDNQIRMGWYDKKLIGLFRVAREKVLTTMGKKQNIITNLNYFFDNMKIGDFVIMKEGTDKIHAIVQINSECKDGGKYYYRDVNKLVVIDKTKRRDIAKIYEKFFSKSLNRTTIYKKSITKNNFFTFMMETLIEVH